MLKMKWLLCAVLVLRPLSGLAEALVVDIQTNYGAIAVQLAPEKAPLTVANFLTYVNEGFYSNTLFHRVIAGFMIQGGGFTPDLLQKATHAPIKLESNNGLPNVRGSIAMARTNVADSATSQFFINSVNNAFLNYKDVANPGYAVFGQVLEGMEVVDAISAVATSKAAATKDVPLQPVLIKSVHVREAQLAFTALKAAYIPGDTLSISLRETSISRTRALDLWVAVRLPNGSLQFVSPENPGLLSPVAKPLKRNVPIETTTHAVLSLVVPKGATGVYRVYAIINEAGADINDLSLTQRSNLASTLVELR
jgi:cyclophilin family peptidyl-prolyl cis-trans isomerase